MNIADTLRKAAQQRRLSVYRIAKDTGLNQSGLNQFFNGTKDDLRLSTVQALFDYLGLEVMQRKTRRQ
ncbi:MAG: helix-turn-helix transcriptional regulator [Pirellulales bacterium]